ncbi:MAG TPA: ABC transporter substrate-binding protein [Acetobacteraceae bacterium]|nr:ABC transporter substrate-binding protein [Acetobacteraceae bacterium]
MLSRRTLLAASAASPMLSAVGAHTAAAATPKDVVVMGKQIDDMIALDPAQAYEFTDNELDGNIYRKLVMPDPKTGTSVIGDLAEKFEVSSDSLNFTFHLRRDAKFDSGKPVTAQDAEFSFHRIVQMNKTPAFILTQFGFAKDNVEKLIRATDDRTLVMTLPAPQATSFVLFCISANVGGIVEKATALAHQDNNDLGNAWLNGNSAGAGPFKLTSWKASDTVILDANPHAATPPGMRRVVIRHMKDPSTQLLSLQRGDIDIARNLGADQLRTLAGNPKFQTISAPQGTSMYFAMNRAVPELAKKEVQQAIKWAIDYDAIAKNITPGVWRVSQSFLPVGLPGALPDTPFHKDVAKAKQLLAAAGLAGGFSVTMDYASSWPYSDIAQAIQADLGAVGIKLQLLPGEQKQVVTKTRARQHQMALLTWFTDYIDPNSNAQAWCADPDDSDNSTLKILAWRSHFADKDMTDEVDRATKELDNKKRMAIYADLQRQMWDHGPFVFLLQADEIAVMPKMVNGFQLGPTPDYFRYAPIRKG